jgi:MOSC domain-containing protein YiiM
MATELAGRVRAVCVGDVGTLAVGSGSEESAFVKTPVDGPVRLTVLGFAGDAHVYEDHGGPDMAVLVYPYEHYAHWRDLGIDIPDAGALAENLTVTGLVETDVHLGDIFELGTSVVQVTQPRLPCYKIAARYERKEMAVEAQETGFNGYLLRVLEEGEVTAGDTMRLIDRESHGVTVAEAGRVAGKDRNDVEAALRVLAVRSLGSSVQRRMNARIASHEAAGLDSERLYGEGADPVL